jgi:hypothetical protein
MVSLQTIQALGVLATLRFRFGRLRQTEEEPDMTLPESRRLPCFQQPIPRILAHCLQQPIPPFPALLVIPHERLVHQRGEQIQNVSRQ